MQFEILKIPISIYIKSISRNQYAKYCKLITKKHLQRWEINDNFMVEQLLSVMLVIWKCMSIKDIYHHYKYFPKQLLEDAIVDVFVDLEQILYVRTIG